MENGRIFARSLVIAACCLVLVFTAGYHVSAEGIEDTGQEQESSWTEVSQEEPTEPEYIPEESVPESQPEEINSTPVEEIPNEPGLDSPDTVPENPDEPGLDSPDNLPVEPEPSIPEDWQAALICLHYDFHVFLYGLIPLSTAILIVVLGCWWFYCTFIRSAL